MALARRLAHAGQHVTLFEREPQPGGLAAGFRVGDAWLEHFYHHIFRSDRVVIRTIEELGLRSRLLWGNPPTSVLTGGSIHRLDSAASLLRFTPLSLIDRLRTAAAVAYLKLEPSGTRLEGERAGRWLRRWMGEASYRTIWQPLLAGKFGVLAEEIGAPWFWARVHDRSSALGYLRGGFQALYEGLAADTTNHGGRLRFGVEVTGIARGPAGDITVATAGGAERFDRVISTLPTRVTGRLAPQLPAWYRDRFASGTSYGAHCLILALDRPLTGTYWLNISDQGYPFMVLVEHTNFLPAADYGGRHLLYLGNYRPMNDPIYAADTSTLLAEYLPFLARINPAIQARWVTDAWSFHAPFAQPIVTVDYRQQIPPFRTPLPGLFVANMYQVYPHDRGQNYSIALAERLARLLLATPRAADGPLAQTG